MILESGAALQFVCITSECILHVQPSDSFNTNVIGIGGVGEEYNLCFSSLFNYSCLRPEPSSPDRTLGSWVRIPLKAWMPVCIYSVFMFWAYVAALRRTDYSSKDSYRLCIRSRNWKSGQGPTKGCRAIDIQICMLLHLMHPSIPLDIWFPNILTLSILWSSRLWLRIVWLVHTYHTVRRQPTKTQTWILTPLKTQKSYILRACFSLRINDQVSHPYKPINTISIWYIVVK
jgi:hypothetical protein